MARPRKFNQVIVLQKAVEVFWKQGYGATSMSDLVEAMDLRPGSIYATFGNKQGLILAAIESYTEMSLTWAQSVLGKSDNKRADFTNFFDLMTSQMASEACPRGCLLVNLLLELSSLDKVVASSVRNNLELIRLTLRDSLDIAQQSGEISQDKNTDELATFLMGTVYSLRVMGRAKASKQDLEIIYTQAVAQAFS